MTSPGRVVVKKAVEGTNSLERDSDDSTELAGPSGEISAEDGGYESGEKNGGKKCKTTPSENDNQYSDSGSKHKKGCVELTKQKA